ncbi:CPBP family intramembrane metalloprotease [bacterium]|nr:CPBP family intramembrane metalloprotease [bacterium]
MPKFLRDLKQTVCQRESLVLLFAVALLCIAQYHRGLGLDPSRAIQRKLAEAVFFLACPLLFVRLGLRENPLRLGLGPGNVRTWLPWTALFIAVMGVLILVVSRLDPSFARYYPIYEPARRGGVEFLAWAASYAAYMFAWEYFFRGFLLFGLERRFGRMAAVIQAVPFALVHVGKPELETYSSIAGGLILGVLALRVRSMWPCFLIHAFIAVWMDVCVVYIWS